MLKMPKEYIEREAFIKILKETKNDCEHYPNKVVCDFAIRMVNLMPTADVQEVRYGKWIEKPYLLGTSNFCSLCGENYGMPHGKYNYCPNCGAKMDKE